jgi:hypothetical protein
LQEGNHRVAGDKAWSNHLARCLLPSLWKKRSVKREVSQPRICLIYCRIAFPCRKSQNQSKLFIQNLKATEELLSNKSPRSFNTGILPQIHRPRNISRLMKVPWLITLLSNLTFTTQESILNQWLQYLSIII